MTNNQKVWVVIIKKVDDVLMYLALKPTPGPNYMYDYYVVTGGVEKDESIAGAASREVKEETGLDIVKLWDLKHKLTFIDRLGRYNIEHCFSALVDGENIVLNEEHIGYEWMTKDKFINNLWWVNDKKELAEIIDSAGANAHFER